MHRTLLLCFIHGFKVLQTFPSTTLACCLFPHLADTCPSQGGDDTFGEFPEHLRTLLSHALPNITVKALTYPKFETRGDLAECVGRFREWYGLCCIIYMWPEEILVGIALVLMTHILSSVNE